IARVLSKSEPLILRDGPSALLRMRGDGAPQSAKSFMARALRHAGASRRANHGVSANGPCFRPVRAQRIAPTDPSASSWQGLLVAPEGAPMPPECLLARRPAGAAPRPASRRLMKRPLTGRGAGMI